MIERTGSFVYLPEQLEYLIEPALKYGRYQFDNEVADFLDRATEDDLESLARVAARITKEDGELIGRFLDEYEITDYEESAKLHFLFGLIDAADVAPEVPEETWNNVESHIESLQKFGSYRLASERMWAARWLADFEGEAWPAVPYLQEALNDEDLRVRVWAHYALAIIVGNRHEHEEAIRAILAAHDERDEFGPVTDIGMEAEAALEQFDELNE